MNRFHLLPQGDCWKLTTEGGHTVFSGAQSRDYALRRAVELVSLRTGVLRIHLADGTLQEERTYPGYAPP